MTKRELIKALAQYEDDEVVHVRSDDCCGNYDAVPVRTIGMSETSDYERRDESGLYLQKEVLVIE